MNKRFISKNFYDVTLIGNYEHRFLLKNFLDNLLSQSHYAIKLIKKNIDFAGNNNLRKTLKLEAKHLIMSSNSKEHKLAVSKFKKK